MTPIFATAEAVKPALPQMQLVERQEYTEERYIPETYYLTAINPDRPEPASRLMVLVEDWQTSAELLVDLQTNDESLHFTMKAVKQFFDEKGKSVKFAESWVPKEPF